MKEKLGILANVKEQRSSPPSKPQKANKRQVAQAMFDRLWLETPRQFDPTKNAMQKERLERILKLIEEHTPLSDIRVADLGCGSGVLSKMLANRGAKVDGIDISHNALKAFAENSIDNMQAIHDFIPYTALEDNSYDLVVSTELIGFLPKEDRRLYFSELARIVKNDGYVVCSTSLDINTEGALEEFGSLAETELQIIRWLPSYHALYIRIKNILKAPEHFAAAYNNAKLRRKQLTHRQGLKKWWYQSNSSFLLGPLWSLFSYASKPLSHYFDNTRYLLLTLEKITKFFKNDDGISHILFIGKRRPLLVPTHEELLAIEPKRKKQVWE